MSWRQKENAIREQRTIEATKKNMMGPSGRLGLIAKILGYPIVRSGGGLYDVGISTDPYEDFVDELYEQTASGQSGPKVWRDEIPEAADDMLQEEGFTFDGLSRGMHLEIQYWHESNKLVVNYKGYLVYKEVAGELEAYAPFDDWENLVNKLYKIAKKRKGEIKEIEEKQLLKEIQVKKAGFWERLRMRWGI